MQNIACILEKVSLWKTQHEPQKKSKTVDRLETYATKGFRHNGACHSQTVFQKS
jgi:hypothetical protein